MLAGLQVKPSNDFYKNHKLAIRLQLSQQLFGQLDSHPANKKILCFYTNHKHLKMNFDTVLLLWKGDTLAVEKGHKYQNTVFHNCPKVFYMFGKIGIIVSAPNDSAAKLLGSYLWILPKFNCIAFLAKHKHF